MRTSTFVDSPWFIVALFASIIGAYFFVLSGIVALVLMGLALRETIKDRIKELKDEANEEADKKVIAASETIVAVLREHANKIKELEGKIKELQGMETRMNKLEGIRNQEVLREEMAKRRTSSRQSKTDARQVGDEGRIDKLEQDLKMSSRETQALRNLVSQLDKKLKDK